MSQSQEPHKVALFCNKPAFEALLAERVMEFDKLHLILKCLSLAYRADGTMAPVKQMLTTKLTSAHPEFISMVSVTSVCLTIHSISSTTYSMMPILIFFADLH